MKYKEAQALLKEIDTGYSMYLENGIFFIIHKGDVIASIDSKTSYSIKVSQGSIKNYKVWKILSDLASTPIEDRVYTGLSKYLIIINENPKAVYSLTLWTKVPSDSENQYEVNSITSSVYNMKYHVEYADKRYGLLLFTEDEYKDLISYIKTLPDGEYQAKLAEHGKTLLFKDDENTFKGDDTH